MVQDMSPTRLMMLFTEGLGKGLQAYQPTGSHLEDEGFGSSC